MGKKTFLVIFWVLVVSQVSWASPYVTSNLKDEIQLTSTTMGMQEHLTQILEARAKGDTASPDLIAAYNKLGDVRAGIICRDSINPAPCRAQTVAQNQKALDQVNALVAAEPGDRIRRPDVWKNSFGAFRPELKKRLGTWTGRYSAAVEQSKAARHSTTAEFEPVRVEFENGVPVIKGYEFSSPVTSTNQASASTQVVTTSTSGTAAGAF